jgi:DNA-binding response OmpR family regulator
VGEVMSLQKKILFVEDNQLDRLILTKILDDLDVEYLPSESAESFLPLVKKVKPDLCLVDLNLKRPRDGEVLIRAIRNILGNSLPIIIISGEDDHEAIEYNLKNGADDFVCKPIDKALLSSKISNFLNSDNIRSKILPVFAVPTELKREAVIEQAINLTAISEKYLHFKTPHQIQDGSKFTIKNTFLKKVTDKENIDLRIVSYVKEVDGEYSYIAEILGTTYFQQIKMRSLIIEKR